MICHKCDTEMQPGKALLQTFTAGVRDFPSDEYASTFSAGGPGEMVDCMKCPECGRSVIKGAEK